MGYEIACSGAFPRLSEAQIKQIAECGSERTYEHGQYLIQSGDKDFPFFVVKSGEVEIVEDSTGTEKEIVVHAAGEFTGDVDLLTRRPALFSAKADMSASPTPPTPAPASSPPAPAASSPPTPAAPATPTPSAPPSCWRSPISS